VTRSFVALAGAAVLVAVALLASAGGASAHYLPASGDQFHYYETVALTNGNGNYSGYTENQFLNGSIAVTSLLSNGTDAATYASTDFYENNQGQTNQSSTSGSFAFSPTTFHYTNGTDDQAGYVDPYVWFFMDNSLVRGATFYSLNTELTVVSTTSEYQLAPEGGKWVAAIFAEGNGTYQRQDVYGTFTATYNWKEYFDPGTGFLVGYVYTEEDSDGSGDGFTWTDTVSVSSTSYALTGAAAPPAPGQGPSTLTDVLVAVAVLVAVVVLVLIVYLAVRSRRRAGPLPQHSRPGAVGYAAPPIPPPGLAPPPLFLNPGAQPPVQQIVVRETVKVPCRYCGTLMDSTATVCPKCGAPRT
jgi:hypothetical protein